MGADYKPRNKPPTHQPDAVVDQANPISTTLYQVLAPSLNVRILSMAGNVVWTVQPTPLEIVVTIDGITITHTVDNPISGTYYYARIWENNPENIQGLDPVPVDGRAFLYEGRNIGVEARTTGGTVQNITARLKHAGY